MRTQEIEPKLTNFVREQLLTEETVKKFTHSTPLFDAGVLDSLRLAMLINFIRLELGVEIPYERVNRDDFHDVHAIAEMTAELSEQTVQ